MASFLKKPKDPTELSSPEVCTWCPGCGDLAIWVAFRQAAVKNGWNNANTALVAGIGCHGHIVNFLKLTSFEGLHGRAIPVASGIKLANHDLNVFVFTGDGDCLAEGGNHFLHACRRNHDMTILLHDNAMYSLTTGQTSPRSPHGFISKSTPDGNLEEPLHPLRVAFAAGATFLARGYAGNIPRLIELITAANNHRGLAIVQVLQPCVTFNHVYTHQFYQENCYEVGADYDPTDYASAADKLQEWGIKQIPVGILYQVERPTYESQIPDLAKETLVARGPQKRSIETLMKNYH